MTRLTDDMLTVCWDLCKIRVDREEFELIKMMVSDSGADKELPKCKPVIAELIKQGYDQHDARELVLMARGMLMGYAYIIGEKLHDCCPRISETVGSMSYKQAKPLDHYLKPEEK